MVTIAGLEFFWGKKDKIKYPELNQFEEELKVVFTGINVDPTGEEFRDHRVTLSGSSIVVDVDVYLVKEASRTKAKTVDGLFKDNLRGDDFLTISGKEAPSLIKNIKEMSEEDDIYDVITEATLGDGLCPFTGSITGKFAVMLTTARPMDDFQSAINGAYTGGHMPFVPKYREVIFMDTFNQKVFELFVSNFEKEVKKSFSSRKYTMLFH